jgi:hypothetical protein
MIWIQIRPGMALWIRIRNPTETIADSKYCAKQRQGIFCSQSQHINTQNEVLQEEIFLHKTVQIINDWQKY